MDFYLDLLGLPLALVLLVAPWRLTHLHTQPLKERLRELSFEEKLTKLRSSKPSHTYFIVILRGDVLGIFSCFFQRFPGIMGGANSHLLFTTPQTGKTSIEDVFGKVLRFQPEKTFPNTMGLLG